MSGGGGGGMMYPSSPTSANAPKRGRSGCLPSDLQNLDSLGEHSGERAIHEDRHRLFDICVMIPGVAQVVEHIRRYVEYFDAHQDELAVVLSRTQALDLETHVLSLRLLFHSCLGHDEPFCCASE